ncbi:MAG TPA: STAS domain-containing protein [Kofleriaceae bacterium]
MREIQLPRSLDISAVRTVATELQDALAVGEVTIDAAELARLDAAGLQLLCAAAAAARTAGARLTWKAVPAVLTDGARTLALTDSLGLETT